MSRYLRSTKQKPHMEAVYVPLYVQEIQLDAAVCRYLLTVKSLYMFRASQHPSSGVLKTVTAASGTGHNIGTATSLSVQRDQWPRWTCWRE